MLLWPCFSLPVCPSSISAAHKTCYLPQSSTFVFLSQWYRLQRIIFLHVVWWRTMDSFFTCKWVAAKSSSITIQYTLQYTLALFDSWIDGVLCFRMFLIIIIVLWRVLLIAGLEYGMEQWNGRLNGTVHLSCTGCYLTTEALWTSWHCPHASISTVASYITILMIPIACLFNVTDICKHK